MTVVSSWDRGDVMKYYNDIEALKEHYVKKLGELETETNKLEDLEVDVAEKETVYRKSKSKAYLNLLADDQKITVIPALAGGKTADIRLLFKVSVGVLRAEKENIKRIHAQIEGYRTLISIAKAEISIR